MTGDIINSDDINTDVVCNLIHELSFIAPVYYGLGNHEDKWIGNYSTLKKELEDSGAIVLEKEYVDISINGNEIRIGGYEGYYRNPIMISKDSNVWNKEEVFFDDFEDTCNYKILLNHIPTQWVDWNYINTKKVDEKYKKQFESNGIDIDGYNVDLVLSGHYHGGQWNLPILGPVYAPYVGFNPKHAKGMFVGDKATCIISAGLGNEYSNIPRVNNPGEIVIIDCL